MWRVALVAALASCGQRVTEPEARPEALRSVSASTSARTTSPSAAATATASAAAPPRCIVPTPEQPQRPAPPAGPDPRCPIDPETPPALRRAAIRVGGLDASLSVEVAERDADRQRGLMFRRRLAENEGMLFVFEQEQELTFWMRNTCLPLDMLFVSTDGVIVGIEENVPTMNDGIYGPGRCLGRYVIEANAGWARRHGVKAGQRIVFGGL